MARITVEGLYREDPESIRAGARRGEARAPDRPTVRRCSSTRRGTSPRSSRCARSPRAGVDKTILDETPENRSRRRRGAGGLPARPHLTMRSSPRRFAGPLARHEDTTPRPANGHHTPLRACPAPRPAGDAGACVLKGRKCLVSAISAALPAPTWSRRRSRRSIVPSCSGPTPHGEQRRASGEPYIHHPVQVARILAEMRLDHETIVAALLHDVIEDTPTAKPHIATRFGDAVADLVDGVSKLTHLSFESRAEAQAENFRKMLMAMARDLRVMLIKLADRLHNMRTLDALPLVKRRRISRETIEIYAPIANRLGLRSIRIELEELGFRALYPRRHRVLKAQVRKKPRAPQARRAQNRDRDEAPPAPGRRQGPHRGPGEAPLQPVPKDAHQARFVQGSARRLRVPDRRRAVRRLLSRAGDGAQPLQAGAGAIQGLHRDPEGERLPVSAHHAVRAVRDPPSRCRSAPRRWTRSRSPGLRRTGCTRSGSRGRTPPSSGSGNGCAICWRCRSMPGIRWSFSRA